MYTSFAPLQKLDDPIVTDAGVTLHVLRLDLYQPLLSGRSFGQPCGNKYFKLKYNLQQAKASGAQQLLSFGGAYSNHIHALAMVGQLQGFRTVGIIRGEQILPLNETLQDASDSGMLLHYVSRGQYRQKTNPDYLAQLQREYPDAYIIPEGGSNVLGVKGCMEIVDHIQHSIDNTLMANDCNIEAYSTIIVPCGTAATLAGIAAAAKNKQVLGIPVLKNAAYLDAEVEAYHQALGVPGCGNWQLIHDYHCGGYAKLSSELVDFIERFQQRHAIPIEPIYSGKMFYGLYQLLTKGYFDPGSCIVAIHTGGLQGLRSMQHKMAQLLPLSDC